MSRRPDVTAKSKAMAVPRLQQGMYTSAGRRKLGLESVSPKLLPFSYNEPEKGRWGSRGAARVYLDQIGALAVKISEGEAARVAMAAEWMS